MPADCRPPHSPGCGHGGRTNRFLSPERFGGGGGPGGAPEVSGRSRPADPCREHPPSVSVPNFPLKQPLPLPAANVETAGAGAPFSASRTPAVPPRTPTSAHGAAAGPDSRSRAGPERGEPGREKHCSAVRAAAAIRPPLSRRDTELRSALMGPSSALRGRPTSDPRSPHVRCCSSLCETHLGTAALCRLQRQRHVKREKGNRENLSQSRNF
ncbi:uncharacterized protein LOC121109302 [Gallus gallus]|uniref:uncharacterized protein LOC121109302 n=1 Tax=Gallus gallus TaxID=9031 RepID=UPI001EFFA17B|nr:uncharacterized protein LOC121109302 [Gallus gallus]